MVEMNHGSVIRGYFLEMSVKMRHNGTRITLHAKMLTFIGNNGMRAHHIATTTSPTVVILFFLEK